jgi:TetR/AcrR family transcriptional regulator, lmrAB and yxaGH operons repressor
MSRTHRRGDAARAKLLGATADLLHRQGYAATGLSEIVERSGAPKGSLYFYFPGGKEELVAAALAASRDELARAFDKLLAAAPTAVAALHAVVMFFQAQLESSRFHKGCPIATVALEQAAGSDPLQAACSAAYTQWQTLVEDRLVREGYGVERAASLATLILSTIEGALILSRAHRSTAPLERAGRELVRILEQGDKR